MKSCYSNSQAADYLAEAKACEKVSKELRRISEKWQRALQKEHAARRAELENALEYKSELELQDAYGWGFLSEKDYERYLDLFRDGEQTLDNLPPSATQIALKIVHKMLGDMDAAQREWEFSALSTEDQARERKRIEDSNREWKKRIAEIKQRRGIIDSADLASADDFQARM